MAWTSASVAQPGQYIFARTVAGWNVDLFGAISDVELVERLRGYVTGVDILQVRTRRDLLSGDIEVFGRAARAVNVEMLTREIESAINSFLSIVGARVNVYVSDSLSAPLPAAGTETGTTIRWLATAAIIVAVALVVIQFKR